jgi:hypothetical protein
LDCSWEIFAAITTSRYLRHSEYSSPTRTFFTYCWVIVDPPPTPPVAWFHTARTMPTGSKPRFE